MSICIMHRLNKRVAVPYDVVEHGNRSYARPAKQLLTAEFSTLSTYTVHRPRRTREKPSVKTNLNGFVITLSAIILENMTQD